MGFYRNLHRKLVKEKRGKWPTVETDYDGNDLWAKAFPKPRPISSAVRYYWNLQANAAKELERYNRITSFWRMKGWG